jgi:hypothetical protein
MAKWANFVPHLRIFIFRYSAYPIPITFYPPNEPKIFCYTNHDDWFCQEKSITRYRDIQSVLLEPCWVLGSILKISSKTNTSNTVLCKRDILRDEGKTIFSQQQQQNSFISNLSDTRQVHSLFQNDSSTECDLELPPSNESILFCPQGHPATSYVFFLVFLSLLSAPLSFLQQQQNACTENTGQCRKVNYLNLHGILACLEGELNMLFSRN